MQTKNDTSKPEDAPEQEAGEGCSVATCSALADCMKHLAIQAKVRKRHAEETMMAVESLSRLDYESEDEYEEARAFNIRQAHFDHAYGEDYEKWADAISRVLNSDLPLGKIEHAESYMEKVANGFDGYAWGHADKGHQNLAAFNAGVAAGWRSAACVLRHILILPNSGVRIVPPLPNP